MPKGIYKRINYVMTPKRLAHIKKIGFESGNKNYSRTIGPWNKGIVVDRIKYPKMGRFGKMSNDVKIKISNSLIGRFAGSKHPLWIKNKIRKYPEVWTKRFKTMIRKRDRFTCQKCFKHGWIVHHIDYNKNNCETYNLITLCPSHHSKTNINRKKWEYSFIWMY